MNIDYTTMLALAAAVCGALVLIDRFTTTQGGSGTLRSRGGAHALQQVYAYARALFPVIVIVLLIRAFVFEPFRIPSASMMPGMVDGDFILVDKYSYGLRLPILHTMIVPIGQPHRGDVIVFRSPADPSIDLIKRLVGLPGDHVVVRDNRLSINGALMPLRPDGIYRGDFGFTDSPLALESFGADTHVLMFAPDRWVTDFDGTVPTGHYFFMGDNRNDSEDSRFPVVGFVPAQALIGHARWIWFNWRIPGWPNPARIGTRIR
jgi:signal peptidase I